MEGFVARIESLRRKTINSSFRIGEYLGGRARGQACKEQPGEVRDEKKAHQGREKRREERRSIRAATAARRWRNEKASEKATAVEGRQILLPHL